MYLYIYIFCFACSHVRTVVATLGQHGSARRADKWQHLYAGFTVWLSQTEAIGNLFSFFLLISKTYQCLSVCFSYYLATLLMFSDLLKQTALNEIVLFYHIQYKSPSACFRGHGL